MAPNDSFWPVENGQGTERALMDLMPVIPAVNLMMATLLLVYWGTRYPGASVLAAAIGILSIAPLAWPDAHGMWWLAGTAGLLVCALWGHALLPLVAALSLGAASAALAWFLAVPQAGASPRLGLAVATLIGALVAAGWGIVARREHHAHLMQWVRPGVLLGGRYRVGRVIGTGSQGEVRLARDVRRRVPVVLKPATDDLDLAALGRVEGAHVVSLLDQISTGNGRYLVMPFLEGGQVRPGADARKVLEETLVGLAAIHDAGLVHRDIKPANLLLDRNGHVHVADFGLATTQEADVTRVAGQAVGTVAFMSPEQARGQRVGVAGDLYAAAAVAYWLLVGRYPVPLRPGETAVELQLRIAGGEKPDLHACPASWRSFLQTALASSAADRFTHARAMRAELPEVMSEDGRLGHIVEQATEQPE